MKTIAEVMCKMKLFMMFFKVHNSINQGAGELVTLGECQRLLVGTQLEKIMNEGGGGETKSEWRGHDCFYFI